MKLGAWMVMITILVVGFVILGFNSPENNIGGTLLTFLGITIGDIFQFTVVSPFWTAVIGAITLAAGATIVIGLYGRGYDSSLIYSIGIVAFGTIFLVSLIQIYFALFSTLPEGYYWIAQVIGLVFAGLGVGYVMATFDYFGGRTN